MSKGRSARGELVDFDLLKIKQQIASAPPSTDVTRRKDFIENRLRRRTKKAPVVVAPVDVEPSVPNTSDEVKTDVVVEPAPISEPVVTPKTKQKARATKTTTKNQTE